MLQAGVPFAQSFEGLRANDVALAGGFAVEAPMKREQRIVERLFKLLFLKPGGGAVQARFGDGPLRSGARLRFAQGIGEGQ